jgi:hemoglobin
MIKTIFFRIIAVAIALHSVDEARAQPPILFQRMGGMSTITAVVDETLRRSAHDQRIGHHFVRLDMARLRGGLIDHLCTLGGGPCRYQGMSMRDAFRSMGFSDLAFDVYLQNLKVAMEALKVPAREQAEMLSQVAPAVPVRAPSDVPAPWPAPGQVGPAAGAVTELAQGLREAASLLDRAETERRKGNRSLAEQLPVH